MCQEPETVPQAKFFQDTPRAATCPEAHSGESDVDEVISFLRGGRYQKWKEEQAASDETQRQRMDTATEQSRTQWEEAERVVEQEARKAATEKGSSKQKGSPDYLAREQMRRKYEFEEFKRSTFDRKANGQGKWHNSFNKDAQGNASWSSEPAQPTPNVPARGSQRNNEGYAEDMILKHLEMKWIKLDEIAKYRKIGLRDIPFPRESSLRTQVQDKKAFQKIALRWHPDRFAPRFGAKLEPKEKDAILEKVKEVFQVINAARGN